MPDFTAGSVLTAAQLDTAFNTYVERAVVTTTATLGAADAGGLLSVNNNSGGTVTIPLNSTWAAETGTYIPVLNAGTAGTWTIGTAVGVTLEGTTTTLAPGAALGVFKRGTNTWRAVPFSSGSAASVSGTTGSPSTVTAAGKTRYTWTGNGDFTISVAGYVEFLVAGGGGTGSTATAASGGGQVQTGYLYLAAGTYAVTIAAAAASGGAGVRGGASSIAALVVVPGGQNYTTTPALAGRSTFDGVYASGSGGGAGAAGVGATGGAGVTSTLADGSTSVEYGKGGTYGANVASPANTGKGGDAAGGTSQNGAAGVVIIAV